MAGMEAAIKSIDNIESVASLRGIEGAAARTYFDGSSGMISDEDSVRIYALCAKCEKVVTVLGDGEITKDENVFIL